MYTYKCNDCGALFDVETDNAEALTCVGCGSKNLTKQAEGVEESSCSGCHGGCCGC